MVEQRVAKGELYFVQLSRLEALGAVLVRVEPLVLHKVHRDVAHCEALVAQQAGQFGLAQGRVTLFGERKGGEPNEQRRRGLGLLGQNTDSDVGYGCLQALEEAAEEFIDELVRVRWLGLCGLRWGLRSLNPLLLLGGHGQQFDGHLIHGDGDPGLHADLKADVDLSDAQLEEAQVGFVCNHFVKHAAVQVEVEQLDQVLVKAGLAQVHGPVFIDELAHEALEKVVSHVFDGDLKPLEKLHINL